MPYGEIGEKIKSKVKNLKKREVYFLAAILVFLGIVVYTSIYLRRTVEVPAAGGSYTEGMVGELRFLNPLYSPKSEVDRDLTEILFSGLMKYDQDGELVPELAKEIKTKEGRIFQIILRDDIYWSDGEKMTSDDFLFTIDKIQSRSVQSPLRISWEGVRTERISEKEFNVFLESPSPLFIEKLTLKPIPKHIWEDVSPNDFQFSELNLDPVSSGPYKINKISEELDSLSLSPNPHYFGQDPYIREINFIFFETENELFASKNKLDGFGNPSIKNDLDNSYFEKHSFFLPRYFALFFNLENKNESTRKALAYGLDKEALLSPFSDIEKVDSLIIPQFYGLKNPETKYDPDPEMVISLLEEDGYQKNEDGFWEKIIREESYFEFTENLKRDDQGEEVRQLQDCLIQLTEEKYENLFPTKEITGYFDEETEEAVNEFQLIFREDILDPHGFSGPTGMVASSTQEKLNEFCGGVLPEEKEFLEVEVTTIDHPLLTEIINQIGGQWNDLGIKTVQKIIDISEVENKIIDDRDYQAFLFGISMESIPDPYRWWHSSQVDSPGLNFTGYQNENADSLLEEAVSALEDDVRNSALEELQEIVLEDKPAIFLYSPNYIYLTRSRIKGIDSGRLINSSHRFSNIEDWYINTKRIWKTN